MTWTTPTHVVAGEADSAKFNEETVDNLLFLKDLLDELATNVVATSEGTSSTSYAALATAGPAVTVDLPGTRALVITYAKGQNGTNGGSARMSHALSGANTVAVSDTWCGTFTSPTAGQVGNLIGIKLHTGLTPGSTTFTCTYRATVGVGGTATFQDRQIFVIPLP